MSGRPRARAGRRRDRRRSRDRRRTLAPAPDTATRWPGSPWRTRASRDMRSARPSRRPSRAAAAPGPEPARRHDRRARRRVRPPIATIRSPSRAARRRPGYDRARPVRSATRRGRERGRASPSSGRGDGGVVWSSWAFWSRILPAERYDMTPEMTPRSQDEAALLELASKRLPGGVLGTSRFRDEVAFVVKRAKGARLWDWSGREYIDYLLGSGPMFLGHAHPAVTKAVQEQLEDGTTYFLV